MSALTEAWDSLYEAQTEATGVAQVCTIGATANIPMIPEEIPRDVGFIDGGTAELQTITLQIKSSSLSNVEPPKKTAVSFTPVGGEAFSGKVLSVRTNNGIMYVLCGDPNANV